MAHPFGFAGGAGALTIALAICSMPSQGLQASETATVQDILDGDELYINRKPARVKARAQAPEVVSTGNSRGQLGFSTGAAGRLNRFSLLRLGSSCFLLEKGQLLVSGPQNGCTRSARLSVRGTNYLVEIKEDESSELTVLEGQVAVETLRDGQPTGGPVTTLEAGQRLRISPVGVVLSLLQLSAGDYTSILSGPLFSGFTTSLPALGALESYIRTAMPDVELPSLPGIPAAPVVPSLPRFGFF
ncbi:MAG: iron dicitrate transport regulator FecR [Cyanobacteria bacterium REEB417]|nr:iron dicitrate transport regulator FecR [Cyanobacteria bacterium REEB417]